MSGTQARRSWRRAAAEVLRWLHSGRCSPSCASSASSSCSSVPGSEVVRNGIPLVHPEKIVSEDRIAASESEADYFVELYWGHERVGRYERSGPAAVHAYCDVRILKRGARFNPPATRIRGADPPTRIVRRSSDVSGPVTGAYPAAEVERYLWSTFSTKRTMYYWLPEKVDSPKPGRSGKHV